jgi:helix-turn-helix protein
MLLPVQWLLRRADAVVVIGAGPLVWGFDGSLRGWGGRWRRCGGWLRRFAARVETARWLFTVLLRAMAAVPVIPAPAGGVWADALAVLDAAVSRQTLDRWIRDWRRGGFDALVPSPCQPSSRSPGEVMELAVASKRENPARTPVGIARILRAQLGWSPGETT